MDWKQTLIALACLAFSNASHASNSVPECNAWPCFKDNEVCVKASYLGTRTTYVNGRPSKVKWSRQDDAVNEAKRRGLTCGVGGEAAEHFASIASDETLCMNASSLPHKREIKRRNVACPSLVGEPNLDKKQPNNGIQTPNGGAFIASLPSVEEFRKACAGKTQNPSATNQGFDCEGYFFKYGGGTTTVNCLPGFARMDKKYCVPLG